MTLEAEFTMYLGLFTVLAVLCGLWDLIPDQGVNDWGRGALSSESNKSCPWITREFPVFFRSLMDGYNPLNREFSSRKTIDKTSTTNAVRRDHQPRDSRKPSGFFCGTRSQKAMPSLKLVAEPIRGRELCRQSGW